MEVGWDEGRGRRGTSFPRLREEKSTLLRGDDGRLVREDERRTFFTPRGARQGKRRRAEGTSEAEVGSPVGGEPPVVPGSSVRARRAPRIATTSCFERIGGGGGNRAVQSSWCTNARARRRPFSSGSSTASETSRPRARMYFLILFDRSKQNGGETKTLAFGRYGRGRFRYSSHVTTRIVVVTADARVRPSPLSASRLSSHGGDAAVEDVDHRLLFPGHLRAHGRDRTLDSLIIFA